MENESVIAISAIGIFCLALIITGVTMITTNVIGANITNATTVAKVYVWNTEPNITSVVISPSSIDLTPGNTTQVNCTAYVWDYNSWEDVKVLNATFYDINYASDPTVDNNYRYYNDTCAACESADASGTNASCTCQFTVWYYANYGSWQCNMTITDQGVNITDPLRNYTFNDSALSGTVTINTVLGINTPNEIDYGNLSVTETSDNITANITNWGNVPINISVRGWGGTGDYSAELNDTCMICQYGNITTGYQRYSANISEVYANMVNLTNTSTMMSAFTIKSKNDTGAEAGYNLTYWKLEVPYTIGGTCNGTIEFAASDAS